MFMGCRRTSPKISKKKMLLVYLGDHRWKQDRLLCRQERTSRKKMPFYVCAVLWQDFRFARQKVCPALHMVCLWVFPPRKWLPFSAPEVSHPFKSMA